MVVWHASFTVAYTNDTVKYIEVVSDKAGARRVSGSAADWAMAIKLPKFVQFLSTLGVVKTPVLPENVRSYNFRFSATTTNGTVNVIGSNDLLEDQVVTNDLSGVSADLNADTAFTSYFISNPNVCLLAIDTTYFDYNPGNDSAEASNLEAGLLDAGRTVITIPNFNAASLAEVLPLGNKLLIPENEEAPLSFDDYMKALITDWVAAGNTLIVFYMPNWIDVFNELFGLSLVEGTDEGPYTKQPGTVGTIYADGPASIPNLSATDDIDVTSLPAGSLDFYSDSGNSGFCSVPYGDGQILIFGWDWYSALPVGGEGAEWLELFQIATA